MIRFWDFKLTGAPPLLSWVVRRALPGEPPNRGSGNPRRPLARSVDNADEHAQPENRGKHTRNMPNKNSRSNASTYLNTRKIGAQEDDGHHPHDDHHADERGSDDPPPCRSPLLRPATKAVGDRRGWAPDVRWSAPTRRRSDQSGRPAVRTGPDRPTASAAGELNCAGSQAKQAGHLSTLPTAKPSAAEQSAVYLPCGR